MKKLLSAIIFAVAMLFSTLETMRAQTWQWAKSGDETTLDESYGAVSTDAGGNVFITGGFYSSTVSFAPITLTNTGSQNAYLVKYAPNGNVLWAKCSDGTGYDAAFAVSNDASGNAYITGSFDGPTLILGTFTLNNSGMGEDVFIAKYDPNGNVLWARSAAGNVTDHPNAINTDGSGNSIITGYFQSPTIVFSSYTLTNTGTQNLFVVKYDANGNVSWAKSAVGTGDDDGVSVRTDAAGNAFVTGGFNGPSIAFGTYTLSSSGYYNTYLVKYDILGNVLWAKTSVGTGTNQSVSVCTDPSGNAYITGAFSSPSLAFGSNTVTLANAGSTNVFFTKYDANGNELWAKSSIGNKSQAYSLASDANNVYMSGYFFDTLIIGTYSLLAPAGSTDPTFIARFDFNGNTTYLSALASGGDDENGICVDKFCNLILNGDFVGNPNNFVVGTNTLTQTAPLGENIFTAKLSFSTNCSQLPDGIHLSSYSDTGISVFPNPSSGIFNLRIGNEVNAADMILINAMGQRVLEQKVTAGENEIIRKELPAGLYNCILLDSGRKVYDNKIIIN